MPLTAGDLILKCGKLKSGWSTRDKKIRDWYKILQLEDKLKQEGMESVVSNDPKTGYNLGRWLLISSIISHKIEGEELSPEEVTATSQLESYITKRWASEEERYRRSGRQRFTSKLVSLLLATGWYSIFAMVTPDRAWAEIWNPIEVYPEFGSDGLIEVAHIYTMTPAEANRKVKLQGWTTKQRITHNVNLYDYWGFDDDGDITNTIVLGTEYVKEPEKDIYINNLMQKLGESTMPVFTSPCGGLPDEGSIATNKKWQENFGESIVATNEQMTLTYNKMLSFIQQASRNAAQARWYEKSTGDTPIVTEELADKWGAIFRMGPNDDIGFIQPPAIPVELRTAMFEYSNMIQRGLFPWVLHGNLQQQLSYLAMANVASSALQQLTPYQEGLEGALSDIDNFWFQMMKVNRFNPHRFSMPSNLPDGFRFKVSSEIQIPGYMVQRATIARMLNPNFRLPQRWIMDRMFPEIQDAIRTQAQVREEDALSHPKAIMVDAILAYREHADRLRKANNMDAAALYDKLADSIEQELGLAQPPAPERPTQRPPRGAMEGLMPQQEVMPRGAIEPTRGLVEL